MYYSCTVYNFVKFISFSKMYKHKSGCHKRKERAVREENRALPKDTTKLLKCLGFITNTFTDIVRNDFTDIVRNDDRDLHNDSSAEHENAWVGNQGANFFG